MQAMVLFIFVCPPIFFVKNTKPRLATEQVRLAPLWQQTCLSEAPRHYDRANQTALRDFQTDDSHIEAAGRAPCRETGCRPDMIAPRSWPDPGPAMRPEPAQGLPSLPLRRFAAFVMDCGFIGVFTITLSLALHFAGMAFSGLSNSQMHLAMFLMVTVPVVMIFAFCEAGLGATPGKALLGLRVRSGPGNALACAATRNVVKFLPWEIAHTGVWIMPGRAFIDPPETLSLLLWTAALALQGGQGVLVLLTGRGLHDRLGGTMIVRAAQEAR